MGSQRALTVRHVFVETNWVVAYAAPAHERIERAERLLGYARKGEIRLYVPAFCLLEARRPIRNRFRAKPAADAVRGYVDWAIAHRRLTPTDARTVRTVLDQFESQVRSELNDLDATLRAIRSEPNVDVFGMSDAMLERNVLLTDRELALQPFDHAVLAAVLVRAEELRQTGESDLLFLCLDADLLPVDRHGNPKRHLQQLYDDAGLTVRAEFVL